MAVCKAWCHIWAEQSPVAILHQSLHEEIRHPYSVEQVSGPVLLFAVILLQLEEIEDVCMPWLEVDGERAFSLASTLVNISGCLIENLEHRQQAV